MISKQEEYSKLWLKLNKMKINLYRLTLGENDKEILKLNEARSKIEEVLNYLDQKLKKE
jgi:hypothetical protein